MTFRHIWQNVMTTPDKILIICLLTLSLGSYTFIRAFFTISSEKTAVVEVMGKEMLRLSLNPQIAPRQIPLKIEKGKAIFDVSHGRVRLLPMVTPICPKHICSKTGWIKNRWEMIVCLPNKIIVRIVGTKKAGDIDFITR